jgi:hypothetical protein
LDEIQSGIQKTNNPDSNGYPAMHYIMSIIAQKPYQSQHYVNRDNQNTKELFEKYSYIDELKITKNLKISEPSVPF